MLDLELEDDELQVAYDGMADALLAARDNWSLVRGQRRAPERAALYVEEMRSAAERMIKHCNAYLEHV